LFNSRAVELNIITDVPATVVMNKDTLKNINNQSKIGVLRQKEPISLTVFNDTISKNISIRSKSSFAFWSNFGFCYGLGMIIDKNSPKRYTFPNTVYVSLKDNEVKYSHIDSPRKKIKYIVKMTPLKIVDLVNPGIELSLERRTGNYFATQLMASYLLPFTFEDFNTIYKPNIKGYRVAIEEKYYFRKTTPTGPYISLELNYLKNRYRTIESFGIKNIYSDSTYNNTNYSDTIRIYKQTFSINFKFGYQFIVNRLSFDFFAGPGLRYKDVRHLDRINPNDEMQMPREPNEHYITNVNGQFWTFSMPLNIRIGWTF
jgi:hypothetical protein